MRSGPAARAVTLCVAVMLAAMGCSRDDEPVSAEPSSSEASASPSQAAEDLHEHDPSTAPAAQQDPARAATTFLRAWSRPELAYPDWWAGIEPLLNPAGRQAYTGTDPAVVPRLEVTGTPKVEKSTVNTSARVWVPTDQGRFGLQLSRVSGHSAWLVSRIYFPESATT